MGPGSNSVKRTPKTTDKKISCPILHLSGWAEILALSTEMTRVAASFRIQIRISEMGLIFHPKAVVT
jgi:hypothetical protein